MIFGAGFFELIADDAALGTPCGLGRALQPLRQLLCKPNRECMTHMTVL